MGFKKKNENILEIISHISEIFQKMVKNNEEKDYDS